VDKVPTVSDTKRAFYTIHTRPINSIYRRVVEELMVEMHLLSVNIDFQYDPIYALGIVSSYDRFMQGYQPEADRHSIFQAICRAVGGEPEQYRCDAERLKSIATSVSVSDLGTVLNQSGTPDGTHELQEILGVIVARSRFKYSRLFAIGLYHLLELADADTVKDEKKFAELIQPICTKLNLSLDKLQKDLELYRGNLEKMIQAQSVMEDILKADRKKREQREQDKNTVGAGSSLGNGADESAKFLA
jgi:photosystem II biogenesis protein Psp29